VFWVLVADGSGCVVPSEAEGTDQLLKRLQELPGFDNQAVIQAMASTDNREFLCWKRQEPASS
jgi:tellurite resistance protein